MSLKNSFLSHADRGRAQDDVDPMEETDVRSRGEKGAVNEARGGWPSKISAATGRAPTRRDGRSTQGFRHLEIGGGTAQLDCAA